MLRGDENNWAKLTLLRSEVACLLGDGGGADADTVSVVERVRYPSAETLAFLARARAVRASHQKDRRRFQVEIAALLKGLFRVRRPVSYSSNCRIAGVAVMLGLVEWAPRYRFVGIDSTLSWLRILRLFAAFYRSPIFAGNEAVRLLRRMKIVGEADVRHLPSQKEESDTVMLGSAGADTVALHAVALRDTASREGGRPCDECLEAGRRCGEGTI